MRFTTPHVGSGERRRTRMGRMAAAALSTAATTLASGAVMGACSLDPNPRVCPAPARPPADGAAGFARVFPKVALPDAVDLAQAPGDPARWYVVQKVGVVRTFVGDDPLGTDTVIDLRDQVAVAGEAGLLAMAFHPQYLDNGQVFLSYTTPGGSGAFHSRISRFETRDGGLTLDRESEKVILELDQPWENHNGGDIGFGPDGYLYIGFGDGGAGGDPAGNGQNTETLLGAMLRIDVDGGDPYAIPRDNPFSTEGGRPEIFAWGLRNPWRWSFDRDTGDLWAGDVGQNAWEEVDLVVRGGNYGWNRFEGFACFGADSCDASGTVPPRAAYVNPEGASVVAGYVYRGATMPALTGKLLYSDFYMGTLWAIGAQDDGPTLLNDSGARGIAGYAQAADGEIYGVHFEGGIYRVVPSKPDPRIYFPATLSQTGCVDVRQPKQTPQTLVPYEINVPFWSDGADKRRWMSLPPRASVEVDERGDWRLPIGTVLVKSFFFDDKPIETRLLIRHADGDWAGYSYEWDEAGADATLLKSGKRKPVGDGEWIYPSRGECLFCHSNAAGRTLGLETAQLDRDVIDDEGSPRSQLELLAARGLFAARGTTLPAIDGPASVYDRARAYLHANCSFCHRPEGPSGRSNMNLLWGADEMAVCDAPPRAGDLDIEGAALLIPGDPERSLLSVRMHSLGDARMPSVGSARVDVEGAALVDEWIAAATDCPSLR
jgi:uncharacterized repeat protein (TIGR03806 family)